MYRVYIIMDDCESYYFIINVKHNPRSSINNNTYGFNQILIIRTSLKDIFKGQ